MSSIYWNVTLVSILNNTTAQINRYFSLFIFAFGIIGNILNVLVLAKKTFRSNPCALCFLVSSVVNIINIVSGLTTRMLSGWAADLSSKTLWLCEFRAFIVRVSRTFAMWIIVLAAVDRWLLTSTEAHRRQMSTLKNAYRGIVITFIFSLLVYVDIFYCYDVNVVNAPSACYGKTYTCRLVIDFTFALVTNIIPIILMLIFGLLTILNVRYSQQRIEPQQPSTTNLAATQSERWKKVDRYLFITLLIQVIVLSILLIPVAIQKLYDTLALYDRKSALQEAVENLIYNIVALFIYIAAGSPFYIFTLCGGKIYRNAVGSLMKDIFRRIKC